MSQTEPNASPSSEVTSAATPDREALGRRVRAVWVQWAREKPTPKSSWLTGWDGLDDELREVDMRIGEALAGLRPTCGAASVAAMLAEFHTPLGQPFGVTAAGDAALRRELHVEEHTELLDAIDDGDRVAIAHELADVVYVAYGHAHTLGIPLDEVIAEGHRANMTKFDDNGPPVLRAGREGPQGGELHATRRGRGVARRGPDTVLRRRGAARPDEPRQPPPRGSR